MPTLHRTIVRPLITEASSVAYQDRGEYHFEVHPDANKVQIRQAVEEIWGVSVVKVNTQNRNGKVKATRMGKGRRNNTRRAIVKLAEGDKIELFETR